jgi:1-acyl-sn-glycerol-3-phosphate acyltransferase
MAKNTRTATIVNFILKWIIRFFVKVEDGQLGSIPPEGPLIVVANHINFLEVPLMISHLFPRQVTGWAKAETWKNPFFAWLFNIYQAIPIRRGESDMAALSKAVEALKNRMILAVSPEGTRSYIGELQQGKPGVVLLSMRSGSPIQPVAYYGSELVWKKLLRFQRSHFYINVGHPFLIDTHGEALSRDVRQEITDEIMYQIAALLPPDYRGVYRDMSQARETYLCFEPGVESNLLRTAETDLLKRVK